MRRVLVAALTAAAAAFAAVWLVSRLGVPLHPLVVPLGVVVVMLAAWSARDSFRLLESPWANRTPPPPRLTQDRRFRSLAWAVRARGGGWEHTVRPVLVASITDWLTQQGADPARRPREAADLLPADLRPLFTDPTHRPAGPTELARTVTRIEQLWNTKP